MKKLSILLSLIAWFAIGCSTDWEETPEVSTHSDTVENIKATILPIDGEETRTTVTTAGSGVRISWASDDEIGIFPTEGYQIGFPMKGGTGENASEFNGGGWGLKATSTYAAYYPFVPDYYLDKTAIPLDYTGQKQTGNGKSAHIGAYDYLSAPSATPINGAINFTFSHLGVLVHFKVAVPKAGTFSKISLSTTDGTIYTAGKLNLTTNKTSNVTASQTKTMSLELSGVALSAKGATLDAYMMMRPASLSGKTVNVVLTDGEGFTYTTKVTGVNKSAGSLWNLTVKSTATWESELYESTDFSKDKTMGKTFQETPGGADIVIVGDGFTDVDIADGTYDAVMKQAYDDFFGIEPFSSLKKHFNVYSVYAVSENRKITNAPSDGINGAIDIEGISTCFSTTFTDSDTSTGGNNSKVLEYAKVALGADADTRIESALVLVMINAPRYAGTCHNMISYYAYNPDDYASITSAIAYIPLGASIGNQDANTMRRKLLHHEANGHGFGKLGDEYFYPASEFSTSVWNNLDTYHSLGLYKNVDKYINSNTLSQLSGSGYSLTTKNNVYWKSLFNTANNYESSEGLGVYEGGYTWETFCCRPTDNSIMNNNEGGFNAPSRWAIWYRLMRLTGTKNYSNWESSLNDFLAWDRTVDYSQYAPLFTRVADGHFKPLAPVRIEFGEWVNGKFVRK